MTPEETTSYILKIGVLTSVALIIAGLIFLVVKPPAPHILDKLSTLRSPLNTSVVGAPQLIKGAEELNGLDIILIGLVVLIATPVAMVFTNILYFIHQRNYLYIAITLVILTNLTIAIVVLPSFIK
ncbi:MAG: DUF1634 domain-containing protein [Pyrobaculum sp.]